MKEEKPPPATEKSNHKLSLENFNMTQVLLESSHLIGSEGTEYDVLLTEEETLIQSQKALAEKIGLHPLAGVETADLFTSEDLAFIRSPAIQKNDSAKTSIEETLERSTGLSRRELNRARRKARQSFSKQNSREIDDPVDVGNTFNRTNKTLEPANKKPKLDDTANLAKWYDFETGTVTDPRCTVPDVTGCWPDSAVDWPLEPFAENLIQDLFSLKWEVRHGAATALRELIRLHGKGAGKRRNQNHYDMDKSHQQWLVDVALRLLIVLGIDRFGDFISDQVVAPVRETCAQVLGSVIMIISNKPTVTSDDKLNAETHDEKLKKEECSNELMKLTIDNQNKYLMGLLLVILKLLEHNDWEARHGGFLALKYLFAVRRDLLDEMFLIAFPSIKKSLSDPVEDVGAMAASALIPIAAELPRLLQTEELEAIVSSLWNLLKEQDDLAVACNSFMGLLAAILSLPAARACLTPQPLSLIFPRLWPFLEHSSSCVRKATLETLRTLSGDVVAGNSDSKTRWGENGSVILQEALNNVFLRVLIEHLEDVQKIAETVWENLVVQSDLELLLHAACPLIGTWLSLAMQPEHIPYNFNIIGNKMCKSKNTNSFQSDQESPNKSSSESVPLSSELKVYIGGIETVARSIRNANVVRTRCMAARMLGLLSKYIVQPAPGVIYESEVLNPSSCYAKVLVVYLQSKSALQRLVTALTMTYWASLDKENIPDTPEILKKHLFTCLEENIYYDENVGSITRLLHDCQDYVATLKHNKLLLDVDTTNVLTLDRMLEIAQMSISDLISNTESKNSFASNIRSLVKRKPKLFESFEERRCVIKNEVEACVMRQEALNIGVKAALAGAATMLHCLPVVSKPLSPLIKPLMEAIKKEENDELQKLAAKHLAHLVNLCADRLPCPNSKIATNLCLFLCSDSEFTPRVDLSKEKNDELFNGILTLTNRQKQAERITSGRGPNSFPRGPGRPPASEVQDESSEIEDLEAKKAKITRKGATAALTEIVLLMKEQLPTKLPQLWDMILPEYLRNYKIEDYNSITADQANQLVFNLQVLEIVTPNLDKSLLPSILDCLSNICLLLANSYKTVRHMVSRCLAVLATLEVKKTMEILVPKIVTFFETSNIEPAKNTIMNLNEMDARRQGAAEALACIVDSLGVEIVPYAVLFMVSLLGRMSDQNQSVRSICSATFATLVQLLPLDPRSIDSSSFAQEKTQERHFLEQLFNPQSIPDTKLTIPVEAELRTYQQQGLNWLDFLNRYKLHGVLCDDMGLGKTLQTLCIVALDHNRNKKVPSSLVICPPTLTGHWVYEAEKFFQTKDLSVIQYAGNPNERDRIRQVSLKYTLVVVNYDIVKRDVEFFESVQWNYCILDEGHVIKNGKTKKAKAVKKLRSHHRLILSGTPVQNDVLELWSLFDFLMPGFLGSERQFAAKYSKPILACREPKAGGKEQEAGALAMEALHRQVLPFLLRRNKEDVLKDLPPKITQDYYCDLSSLQKSLYEDFKLKHSAKLLNEGNVHRGHVFEALRYLKNVCNHPKLVLSNKHPQYQTVMNSLKQQRSSLEDIDHSAKLLALKQLLLDCGIGSLTNQDRTQNNLACVNQPSLVSPHRALIFCQLKAMLDIVEHDLLHAHLPNVTYIRLDGSVPAAMRHSIVARFNADPSIDVLLLTTQVGGLGLNLTGADTVIFVEHDWNPMKDLQAMDRAHRIGQKKIVNVYRLITRQTLEEKIMGLQKFKLLTANTVISSENSSLQSMRTDQLLDLFSLDKDKKALRENESSDSSGSEQTKVTGISNSIVDILPELIVQQQYEEEYDLDVFLSTLKETNH